MRSGPMRRGTVLAGCLAVLLVGLLVGVLAGWLLVVALSSLGLAACEIALHRTLVRALPRQVSLVLGELYVRLPLEQALLLVYVVREPRLSETAQDAVVLAVVLYQILRLAHSGAVLAGTRLSVPRASARDLAGVPHRPVPSLAALTGPRAVPVLVAATGLPALALLYAAVTGSFALLVPAAVAMVLVAAAVVGAALWTVLDLIRRPRGAALVAAVHDAVLRHGPEVVLYSNGGPNDLHWVTSWLDTLDALGARGRPARVIPRHPPVLDLLPAAATPLVCLPDARDVLPFTLPDARVALYVANSPENTRLLRSTQLRSAMIGHGESDKASSASPLAKMYDEVWVAGEAAVARYLEADVGVRAEQLRVVGRPQVRRVAPASPREPGAPCSVLYAPTWEGIFGESSAESSLLRSGVAVVRGLLSLDGVRLLYRPHPNTGRRDSRYVREHEQILALLAAAGAPHAGVPAPTPDVYEALNMADVLIADVSAVIVDFLASGKPYLIVNDTDLSESQFRERFLSAAGGGILGRGAEGLAEALADARGPDSMRAAREQVRLQLIGPPTDDPIGVFAAAIDALGDTLIRPARGGVPS